MKKRSFIRFLALSVVVIALTILPYALTGCQNVIAKNAIEAANRLTGLNELKDVHITAEHVVIQEAEDNRVVPK